jgi:hypothetical protein
LVWPLFLLLTAMQGNMFCAYIKYF